MELKREEIGAIILAGGKSRRFGTDKILFPFRGKPMIVNIIEVVKQVTDNIIIITNSPQQLKFLPYPKYNDLIPNSGPLGGIYTGLYHSRYQLNFVLPCDMPNISSDCLQFLVENSHGFDVTVPYHRNMQEPLCAIYSKNCLPIIKQQISAGNFQVFQFYDRVRTKRLAFTSDLLFYHEHLFFNINSRTDLIIEENRLVEDQIHQ